MVREGYKQTEIGVIPEEWEVRQLGEVGDVIGGGTPKTSIKEFWLDEINWFTPSEIGNKKYVKESVRRISKLGLLNSSAKLLPKNTIMLTTRASIGDCAILLNEAATNQGFQSLIVNKNNSFEFVYYLILLIKGKLLQEASGSTFLEVSPNKVRSIKVSLPPLKEQEAIAEALSDTDEWINSLEELIAKKRLIKQGAMQELLTPKEGWEVKKFFDLLDEIIDNRGKTPPLDTFGYNLLEVNTLGKLYPQLNKVTKFISSDTFKLFLRKYLERGDLLFSTVGNIGKTSVHKYDNCCIAQNIVGFRFKNSNVYFMKYYFDTQLLQNKFIEILMNGVQPSIKVTQLTEIEFLIPTPEEQEHIATILSDMDREIGQLEEQLDKAKQIKQGMMQELLTGRVRLVPTH